ncbi:MAG: patatin-like phospholipase family protein, partial [Rubrobacter sp.]
MFESQATIEEQTKNVDLVFEGGGLKGIALVGAYSVLEEEGYSPQNVAGASAGAIVAALVAADYTAAELRDIIGRFDFRGLKDRGWEDWLPLFPRLVSVLKDRGIYEGEAFQSWISSLLEAKGIRTFGDLVCRPKAEPTGPE